MVIFPILLAFVSGLLILRLCNQHKFLNIFEQLALGFVTALSLFVFELFLQGVIFNHLSLLFPVVTLIILLVLFVYKNIKHTGYLREIIDSIKHTFLDIGQQFVSMKAWKKYLLFAIAVYILVKVFMVFSINTYMPTFDEDAVAGWDMKTKIFAENKSLVLDQSSPEFLGSALDRNIFAPLTDTYFLLASHNNIDGFANVLSPLLYFLSLFLLFGIFLRKTNLFFAMIGGYIFISLPFVFIHGFGSYRNFISGMLLFTFIFYILDQILNLENNAFTNKKILLPLFLLAFLTTTIRNESFILVLSIILICSVFYYIVHRKYILNIKYVLLCLLYPFVGIFIGRISGKYILSLYPQGVSLNIGGIGTQQGLLNSLLTNINQPGILNAPLQQAFYHSDYNILFLLLILIVVLCVLVKMDYKKTILHFLSFLILLGGTIAILFANLNMGLLTHFGFVRFSVVYIIFMVFLLIYGGYILSQNFYFYNKS